MNGILKIFFTATILGFCSTNLSAQIKKMNYRDRAGDTTFINTQVKEPRVKKPKALTSENAFGARLLTDGWALYFRYGIIKKNEGPKWEVDRFYDVLYFSVEAGERYHPKEYRDFQNVGGSTAYSNYFLSYFSTDMLKFGKINNFYTAKVGVGYQYLLAGKAEAKSIAIHWNTNVGVALGLVKPYYFITGRSGDVKLDPKDPDLLNTLANSRYTGGYGYRKGWNELKVVPGFYVRSGLKFDYANRLKSGVGFVIQ